MLYRGQAACLVLSLPPTEKNREKAKNIFAKSQFDVTYVRNSDPFLPMAIGKKTKELNPFLYLSYPPTPTPAQLDTPTLSEEPLQDELRDKEFSPEKPLPTESLSNESLSDDTLPDVSLPVEPSSERSSTEQPKPFRTPKVEEDENKQKQELFNKLKSLNNESRTNDEQENLFDGGLNGLYEMDYDVDDTPSGRIPDPVFEGDRVNIETDYEYSQGTENSSDIEITEKPSKRKNIRKSIDKVAVLNFSKKMFTKSTPETPSMYDYVFMSSVEMLETISNYIDIGDLTSKRYQYWLSKSEGFGSVDTYQTLDGTNISGRYLYVLKNRHRKTLVRRHKQQHEQLLQ